MHMFEVIPFLRNKEAIDETIEIHPKETEVDYSIHILSHPDLNLGEEVLLEIRKSSEPCVLIGGNPVQLDVLYGVGRLAMIELATGKKTVVPLDPGTQVEVSSHNNLYWYENDGEDPLVIRDHCDNFDLNNEPSLHDVVVALSNIVAPMPPERPRRVQPSLINHQ